MNSTATISARNSTDTLNIVYLIPWLDNVYGGVSLLGSLIGTVGNLLSIRYFARDRTKVSNMLYLWMIGIDVVTCVSLLHFGVARIYPAFGVKYLAAGILCNIFGFLYNISSRLSVFIVALQSILRSYSLVYPFKKTGSRYVLIIVSVMAAIQVFQASLPYLWWKKYEFNSHWTLCLWYLDDICKPESKMYNVLYILTLILPFLLPAVPVLISCGVSITFIRTNPVPDIPGMEISPKITAPNRILNKLCCSSGSAPAKKKRLSAAPRLSQLSSLVKSRLKHRATVTILIITGIYIILNIPYWVYLTYNLIMPYTFSLFDMYLGIFLNPLCVILNAAINPVVYFLRISGMRSHVTDTFKNIPLPRSPRPARRMVNISNGISNVNRSCVTFNSLVVERTRLTVPDVVGSHVSRVSRLNDYKHLGLVVTQ